MSQFAERVRRVLREEGGFTLPEMLVTILIMLTVLFALYNIFDMSIRVFSFGNDKVEAVENARLGLEKMEREIRAAYPYYKTDNSATNDYLFPLGGFTSNSITFGNDSDGNRKIDSASEQITYTLSGSSLQRNSQPVVEFVGEFDNGPPDPADNDTPLVSSDDTPGLQFTYLQSDGVTAATTESEIDIVHIILNIRVEGGAQDGTQTLTTDVALRNRES